MKNIFQKVWFRTKEKVSEIRQADAVMIVPYLSYANHAEAIIRGRVIENENIVVHEEDGKWENFVNSLKRMESDEIKNIRVALKYNDNNYDTVSDDEGYFSIKFPINGTDLMHTSIEWHTAYLSLPDYENEIEKRVEADVSFLVLPPTAAFAIISDIDDTILQSHVNSFLKLRLLYETFLKNIHSRKAFENIGEALNKLVQGADGKLVDRIFYISNNPWNLHEVLELFLAKNNIPKGPFFLRDFGYKPDQEKIAFKQHKAISIEHLMNFYPDLSFILIGDATEHDVDVYLDAYIKEPTRVLGIFIRAAKKAEKNLYVKHVIAHNSHVPIHLIHHSYEIVTILQKIICS